MLKTTSRSAGTNPHRSSDDIPSPTAEGLLADASLADIVSMSAAVVCTASALHELPAAAEQY